MIVAPYIFFIFPAALSVSASESQSRNAWLSTLIPAHSLSFLKVRVPWFFEAQAEKGHECKAYNHDLILASSAKDRGTQLTIYSEVWVA